jgi:hypothetical protein
MHSRFAFEHPPYNPYPSHPCRNIPSFVFNLLRILPFLVYTNVSPSPFAACALFAKKTGGPLRIAFPKLKRIASAPNFQLSILNCKLPPLTALFPPLTNRRSVSPLLATLTRMRGRGRVLCFPASCVCTDPVALLAPSSQRNPLDFGYNLRFALLALGPTSEVSG